jgi:hypothetical protein
MQSWRPDLWRTTKGPTVCLIALVAAALAWQSILNRYQPRFRWSLKTMLVGVTLACALCASCVATRNRADKQDELISPPLIGHVYFERWGPKWLDLLGAARFRRRIVAAWMNGKSVTKVLVSLPDLRG